MDNMDIYLRPTAMIDSDAPNILEKVSELVDGQVSAIENAITLYYFVRDEILYDVYVPILPIDASVTLRRGSGFCTQKAILLTAMSRAVGIPARLGFAAIRNYALSEVFLQRFESDYFPYDGFSELYLEGKWVRATPAFHLKLCEENRLVPVDFDGRNDALLPSHTLDGKPHVEYIKIHGTFDDVPLETFTNSLYEVYSKELLDKYFSNEVAFE